MPAAITRNLSAIIAEELRNPGEQSPLDPFLEAESAASGLELWVDLTEAADTVSVKCRLLADIAKIDSVLNATVNAVLHHSHFQRLEATWRGLAYLVRQPNESGLVAIRLLDVIWSDLRSDANAALEFDQGVLFQKVYEGEFGTAGGQPFGLLLADYAFPLHPAGGTLPTLEYLTSTSAAAFAPVVIGVDPEFFGVAKYADLFRATNLSELLSLSEYVEWRSFCEREDSRFTALVMPRVLMRTPYKHSLKRVDGFRFVENVHSADGSEFLWGTGVYAIGALAIRSFDATGWFSEIVGSRPDAVVDGTLKGLAVDEFEPNTVHSTLKFSTDIAMSDFRSQEFADHGFIPICRCKHRFDSVVYNLPLVSVLDRKLSNAERTAYRLDSALAVCRIAHHLKAQLRDKIGSYSDPSMIQSHINGWLKQYIAGVVESPMPLRSGTVSVKDIPGRPGDFYCEIEMTPNLPGLELSAAVRLRTREIPKLTPPQLVESA